MPSFRHDHNTNPWTARVTLEHKTYYLGSYPSKFLAFQAEARFKNELRLITLEAQQAWEDHVQANQA